MMGTQKKGKALFLTAIMLVSVVGMTMAFAGTAAADVTAIGGSSADDVPLGQQSVTEQLTLTGVQDDGNGATLTIATNTLADVTVTDASVNSSDFSSAPSATVNNGDIEVTIPAEATTADVTLDVTYDTSNKMVGDTQSASVSASTGTGSASVSIAFVGGEISGSVTNPAGDAVTGLTVDVDNADTDADVTTATGGTFTTSDLADGTYNVSVATDGYSDSQIVTVSGGEDVDSVDLVIGPSVTTAIQSVTTGATQSISADLTLPSGQSVNYDVATPGTLPSGATTSQGPTSSDFSVVQEFSNDGDYYIVVEDTDNSDLYGAAKISSLYDANITVDPVEPNFDGSVSVTGKLTDADGNAVSSEDLDLVNPAGTVDTVTIATTASTGEFAFSKILTDAGTWNVTDASQNAVYQSIEVQPADANVTMSVSSGDSLASFQSTYLVEAKQTDDSVLPWSDSSADNYVNVTGPFDSASVTTGTVIAYKPVDGAATTASSIPADTAVEYFHVVPDDTGSDTVGQDDIVFDATPTEAGTIGAELDNSDSDAYAGVERSSTGADSPDQPDFTGATTIEVGKATDLTVDVTGGDALAVDGDSTLDVSVIGADGNAPDGDSSNALDNATVTLTGPGVTVNGTQASSFTPNTEEGGAVTFGSSQFEFSALAFEEAGTATIEVAAYNDSGAEFTYSESFSVAGDNLVSVSPTTVNVTDNEDITVEVSNNEGTAVNNRVVVLSGGDFKTNTTSNGIQTVTNVVIDGASGAVYATDDVATYNGDYTLNADFVANDGTYIAENISFETTGDINVDVYEPDQDNNLGDNTQTVELTPITVQGIESYDVQTDIAPVLAGQTETHNVTVTQDGAEVNGTDLQGLTIEVTQTGDDTDVTQSGLTYEDFDNDGTVETVQVDVRPDDATVPVNISINPDGAQTGSAAVEVVEPKITTTLGSDDLTLGLNETDVEVTAEDPRNGDALADADVRFTAANTTFEIDGDKEAVDDGNTPIVNLDANGTATVSIAPNASETDDGPISLGIDINNDGSEYFGDTTIDVGEISVDGFDQSNLDPDTQYNPVLDVVDANGDGIDLGQVTLSGDFQNAPTEKILDEGTVAFDFTTDESGMIALDLVENDNVEIVADGNSINLDEYNVLEQVELGLSAEPTELDAGSDTTFTLERNDFNEQTTGNLTVYNASEEVVEQVEIDGTLEYTFEDAGEYTVEAEKAPRPQVGKAFLNDSVTVTVNEVVEPGAVELTNVDLTPNEVDANTTNDHTLTFDAVNVSDDNSTDSFTVTVPEAATLDDANNVNVTDADGETVAVEGLDVSGNEITFDVNPDTDATNRDLTVEADITVSAPDVAETTEAEITIGVEDSDDTSDSAAATLTVVPEDDVASEVPEGQDAAAVNAIVDSAGVDNYTQLQTLDILDAYSSFLDDGTVGETELENSLPILDFYAYALENPDEFGN